MPGAVDVLGLALGDNSSLTVNSAAPWRKGEYFRKEVAVANSSVAVWQAIAVAATGETTVNGNVFVPKTPENYTYDDDGNLTQDGRWDYTWDAENRLVKLVSRSGAPGGSDRWAEFTYDGKSRRIGKKVWNNTTGTGSPASEEKFLYDGWNLLAVLSSSSQLQSAYTWGLDLSGTLQGAGGVGGLLMLTNSGNGAHFCAYDGNGNVAALVKASDGTVSANYEYGPFGEALRVTGTMGKANPFRFSSKYQDDESDFLYYGYRSYNPSVGRWISRDPIGERGGLSLYGFIANHPLAKHDRLGLEGGCGNPVCGPNGPVGPSVPYCAYNPWERRPPFPGPGVLDQCNILGLRGRTGTEDYTAWFEQRFPKSIDGAKKLLAERIKAKACAKMGSQPASVPDLIGGEDDVDLNPNMLRFGDNPQSPWERNVCLGAFEVKAANVRLTWQNRCCFTYTATVFVQEHTGADAPWEPGGECCGEDPLWFTFCFVSRNVRMAEWQIAGKHCCPFRLLSLEK